jgi:hypothetical protein
MITVTAKNEYFFREPRLNRVIVLCDLDYSWQREDLKRLKRMRAKGLELKKMVYEFDRNPDETFLALIHLATTDEEKYRQHNIIILEHLDFLWDWSELRELCVIWERGLSSKYASNYFERPMAEIVLAVMHLARINKIKRRRGGLF